MTLLRKGAKNMPFDKTTAAAAGQKGGSKRWQSKDPETKRDTPVCATVTKTELAMIDAKARAAGLSRAGLIVQAVNAYNPNN